MDYGFAGHDHAGGAAVHRTNVGPRARATTAARFRRCRVRIAVNHRLLRRTPDFVEFLRNYETELFHTNEALAYMELTGGDAYDVASGFCANMKTCGRSGWTPTRPPA